MLSYKSTLLIFLSLGSIISVSFPTWAQNTGLKTPNISANALFLYQNSNFHKEDADPTNLDQEPNGLKVQEAELQFYSDVDPYTRLYLLMSIHSEFETNGTDISEKWLIEPEEAFMDSNFLSGFTFKVGKFKAAMGKHNTLHTHAYPFIKSPISNSTLLGDEGLNDVGISAALLLPTSWFSEFTMQYFRGDGENAEFKSPTPGDGVLLGHFKNLFDLTDDLTMEIGASYAQGGNSYKKNTSLTGADLTFKWRPAQGGRYYSFLWATEYLSRVQSQPDTLILDEKGDGFASWVQYQFAERWAVLYRYDQVKIQNSLSPTSLPNDKATGNAVAIAFNPSEFSTFKLEYDSKQALQANAQGDKEEKALFVQAHFTIGSHPAHSY